MQRTVWVTASSAPAVLLALAGLARANVVDTREIEETVPVTAGQPLVVIVKNITGSVRVTGHDSDRIEMHATETVRGDLQADIARARTELGLRTESEPGRVAFRVRGLGTNGEAIENGDCDCHNRRWDEGYHVEYDIELRVPRGATLDLATITDGDVTAEGVSGDFTIANVNGGVRLTGLVGSGSVNTVNGKLDVTFPESLSADLEFATMQGDVFTDFEVASLVQAPTVNRDDNRGRFVMRSNRNSAFRVGSGGEKHSFHTLNGDIYVRKAN